MEREGTEITHVLLTHHHWDHVLDVEQLAERFGAPVLAHPKAAELLEGKVTDTMDEGDVIESRLAPDRGAPHARATAPTISRWSWTARTASPPT